ncbi:F-box protein CPR1-like [Papaver somniferum]|uniref:F-box protein CPR1-like n=1 Tax=Papaver somniferum TaxID=3469 RepID=UPI000E6F96A9|nr:F-box protein CPR1-like [Papaver somniferum]XP_026379957.1 F-box protein CPR1-like [Papaver somniferum]XP_026379958.1 F-box protein CPR1-like [Papaver somniferum]XP_026379959.1 F-box protein CPR1-like [Papaver somniferum]XP_026379961.1 F-box protein CPR1-like [Papaver somniferum]
MSSLPEDLYPDIFSRLPVKSLLLCKCVCKNWYALICTSDFVKFHLNLTTQKNNPIFMLKGLDSDFLYSIDYDLLASSVSEIEADAIEMDHPFKSLNYGVDFLYSIVWIWLSENDDDDRDHFCFWNPATREYKEIPSHKRVYMLESNSWKDEQTIPYQFLLVQNSGVLVNGHLHWLVSGEDDFLPYYNFLLISLDISDDSFKEMQLPKEFLEESTGIILGELEGCLCALVSSDGYGALVHFEVWKMLDHGIRESMSERYVIVHDSFVSTPFYFKLVWSFNNGEILFLSWDKLVLYEPNKGSAQLKTCSSPLLKAEYYFESLVSLNSGSYVGAENH